MGGDRHTTRRSRDEGVRRAEILDAAIDRFGRNGYENTKWADIAEDVGIGPTALYHYFASKQHCLYVILGQALSELHERFDTMTADHADPREALRAVCTDCFDLRARRPPQPRPRRRAGSPGQPGELPRRRAGTSGGAREDARARDRLGALPRRRDAAGRHPRRDPRMLARAMLGLYNSIWHWYRPDQTLLLPTLAQFFTSRMLAVAGVPPETAHRRPEEPARAWVPHSSSRAAWSCRS